MLQVRFISDEQKADEYARSRSKVALLPSDIAKPIGLLNGTSTGGSKMPRTSDSTVTSECVSYRLDENGNKVDAHVFRSATTRKPNRRNNAVTFDVSDAMAAKYEAAARLREIVGTNNIGADYS